MSDVQGTKVGVEAIVREGVVDCKVERRVNTRPGSIFGRAVRRLGGSFSG